MEFDPSARDLPPPRHAIESDSEDSEDDVEKRNSSSSSSARIQWRGQEGNGIGARQDRLPLIVFLGSTGEAFIREQNLTQSDGLFFNDEQQGAIHLGGDVAHEMLLRPGRKVRAQQAYLPDLANTIIDSLQPTSLIVIDDYFPSLYLSQDERERQEEDAPIRSLHGLKPALQQGEDFSHLAKYEPPNYLTGLGAALINEASIAALPVTALLVPQLHSANPHLQAMHHVQAASSSTLDARPEPLEQRLIDQLARILEKRGSVPQQRPSGTADGHSASAPVSRSIDSYLDERRTRARKEYQEEVSSMYM